MTQTQTGETVTLTLRIENTYELYDEVVTTATVTVPAPPPEDSDEYDEWAVEHIHDTFGAGHEDGDAWYDAVVTESSDPALVGRKFDAGY